MFIDAAVESNVKYNSDFNNETELVVDVFQYMAANGHCQSSIKHLLIRFRIEVIYL